MQREQKYATPFSSEENGVARQKNADGAYRSLMGPFAGWRPLTLMSEEMVPGLSYTKWDIILHPFIPGHGTRICYPGTPHSFNALPPLKGEVVRRTGGVMAEAGGDPSGQWGPRKAARLCGDKDEQRNGAAPPDPSASLRSAAPLSGEPVAIEAGTP